MWGPGPCSWVDHVSTWCTCKTPWIHLTHPLNACYTCYPVDTWYIIYIPCLECCWMLWMYITSPHTHCLGSSFSGFFSLSEATTRWMMPKCSPAVRRELRSWWGRLEPWLGHLTGWSHSCCFWFFIVKCWPVVCCGQVKKSKVIAWTCWTPIMPFAKQKAPSEYDDIYIWLVVSIPLKNISQLGWLTILKNMKVTGKDYPIYWYTIIST